MAVGLGVGEPGVCDGVGVRLGVGVEVVTVGEADADGVDDAVAEGDAATVVAAAVGFVGEDGTAANGTDAGLELVVGAVVMA